MNSPSIVLHAQQDTPDISAGYETTFRYLTLIVGALRLLASLSHPQDTSTFLYIVATNAIEFPLREAFEAAK